MAGMMGSSSARPRLSPSAISAICCAAKAGSQELKVEKMAPAIAVPASDGVVRPFGRFCMERREVGNFVGVVFGRMAVLGELLLMLKHLALSMAIVAMVAAIVGFSFDYFQTSREMLGRL